jgi:hypothetical protein
VLSRPRFLCVRNLFPDAPVLGASRHHGRVGSGQLPPKLLWAELVALKRPPLVLQSADRQCAQQVIRVHSGSVPRKGHTSLLVSSLPMRQARETPYHTYSLPTRALIRSSIGGPIVASRLDSMVHLMLFIFQAKPGFFLESAGGS